MLQTFSVATNEYRGGNGERTEYHACVAWVPLSRMPHVLRPDAAPATATNRAADDSLEAVVAM